MSGLSEEENKVFDTLSSYINKDRTIDAMEKYGGSFIRALASALRHADMRNFMKLTETFPEYWKQYTEIARKDYQQEELDDE